LEAMLCKREKGGGRRRNCTEMEGWKRILGGHAKHSRRKDEGGGGFGREGDGNEDALAITPGRASEKEGGEKRKEGAEGE
jgi:hypothetical protein